MVSFIPFALALLAGASQSFDSVYRSGLVALAQNHPAEAAASLEAAAKLQPANGRVWVGLADAYLRLGKRADAETAAQKAESLSPHDALVSHTLALYYAQTARPLRAAELESAYAAATPSDTSAWQRAGEWYFAGVEPLLKQEKFAAAVAILEPARAKIPADAQLQLALGVAYYGLRRFDEAAAQFLKAMDLAPEARQPYVFLGRMLDQTPAKLEQIAPRFNAWRKSHPEDELGYLLEGRVLNARNRDPETARELLRKATELAPSDAAAYSELGTLDERTQHLPDAAAEFERAAALNPADPVSHYHLARIYDRLGQHDRARAERETHAKLVAAQDAVR